MGPLFLLLLACILPAPVGADCLRLSEMMAQPDPEDWSVLEVAYGMDWPVPTAEVPEDFLNEPPDWVELCNVGDLDVESHWYSLAGAGEENPYAPTPWTLPRGLVGPGACIVIILEPDCVGYGCADFDLQQENGFIQLAATADEDEACFDQLLYDQQDFGVSMVRDEDGGWRSQYEPTPGEPTP